jgi:hypothetical protein
MHRKQHLAAIALLATIVQTAAAAATMQPIWLAGAVGIWLFVLTVSASTSDTDQE